MRWRRRLLIEGQEAGARGRPTKQRSVDNRAVKAEASFLT